jgi:hypothetical protein
MIVYLLATSIIGGFADGFLRFGRLEDFPLGVLGAKAFVVFEILVCSVSFCWYFLTKLLLSLEFYPPRSSLN